MKPTKEQIEKLKNKVYDSIENSLMSATLSLLGEELDSAVSIAFIHGWHSSRYEQRVNERTKINQLKSEL